MAVCMLDPCLHIPIYNFLVIFPLRKSAIHLLLCLWCCSTYCHPRRSSSLMAVTSRCIWDIPQAPQNACCFSSISNSGTCAHKPQGFFDASKSLLDTLPLQVVDRNNVMRLSLYGHQVFRKFTCKVLGVLMLACGDTSISNDFALVDAILLLPLLKYLICHSDMPILVTFLKVLSSGRTCKCFSTCLEHLDVVLFFYSIIIFMYMKPMNTKGYISNMV